ncbi:hypothetical protein GCM10027271_46460 [Saccharopolyspora gloriosae]
MGGPASCIAASVPFGAWAMRCGGGVMVFGPEEETAGDVGRRPCRAGPRSDRRSGRNAAGSRGFRSSCPRSTKVLAPESPPVLSAQAAQALLRIILSGAVGDCLDTSTPDE